MRGKLFELDNSRAANTIRAEEHQRYQERQGRDDHGENRSCVLGLFEVDTQPQLNGVEGGVDEACGVGGGWAAVESGEAEMNASRQRPCYHGNFGGSAAYQVLSSPTTPALQPIMSFHSRISASPTEENGGQFSNVRQPSCLEDLSDVEGFVQDVIEMNAEQQNQMVGGAPSFAVGGRFRTFGPMEMPSSDHQSSWHKPVEQEMQYYPDPQPEYPPSGFVLPTQSQPQQMPNAPGCYGGFEGRMGQIMPLYNHHHHNQMGVPSGDFFMGPMTSQQQQQQQHPQQMQHHLPPPTQRHFQSMASASSELNDRRAAAAAAYPAPSGSHLSIMASNLNPPEHMLHIYPSNSTNR